MDNTKKCFLVWYINQMKRNVLEASIIAKLVLIFLLHFHFFSLFEGSSINLTSSFHLVWTQTSKNWWSYRCPRKKKSMHEGRHFKTDLVTKLLPVSFFSRSRKSRWTTEDVTIILTQFFQVKEKAVCTPVEVKMLAEYPATLYHHCFRWSAFFEERSITQ